MYCLLLRPLSALWHCRPSRVETAKDALEIVYNLANGDRERYHIDILSPTHFTVYDGPEIVAHVDSIPSLIKFLLTVDNITLAK